MGNKVTKVAEMKILLMVRLQRLDIAEGNE